MIKRFGRRKEGSSGMTVLEVAVVMAISAIVMTGLLVAYAEGVHEWGAMSDMIELHDEGRLALSLMGRFVRNCNVMKVKSFSGLPTASMELDYPDEVGGGSARFYFVHQDGSLRWNDQTEGNNRFNMRLLPAVRYLNDPEPYLRVRRAQFIPLDERDVGFYSPTLKGYDHVRIELVLEDDKGDTLFLSSVVSKRNK